MVDNNPSLCIPRLFATSDFPVISQIAIKNVIDKACIGDVKRIDIVERQGEGGLNFVRVFIHFHNWFDTEQAQRAKKMIMDGKSIKIVYSEIGFWKLMANNWVKK